MAFTVKYLKNEAKRHGIKGYSKFTSIYRDLYLTLFKSDAYTQLPKKNIEALKKAISDNRGEYMSVDDNKELAKIDANISDKINAKMGLHVMKDPKLTFRGSISAAVTKYNLRAVQIFAYGPRSMKKQNQDEKKIKQECKSINLYVHSSYLTNPWGAPKYLKHTVDHFVTSAKMGSLGVIIHIPKMDPEEIVTGVKILVDKLNEQKLLQSQRVILEMKALKQHATKSYETPEKINNLTALLKSAGITSDQVGICVDTAHVYAGKAQISTYAEASSYLDKLDREWMCLFHINGNEYDSKKRAGDKHAIPIVDGKDMIWKDMTYQQSGCRAFIEYCRDNDIDFILEAKSHHTAEMITKFQNILST